MDVPPLPGTWQEEELPGQFAGSTYRITFRNDLTFQLKSTIFTDAIDRMNPCRYDGIRYIRGRYTISGAELRLSGKFCDSTYSVDSTDCYYGAARDVHHTLSGKNGQLILDNERGDYYRMVLNRE